MTSLLVGETKLSQMHRKSMIFSLVIKCNIGVGKCCGLIISALDLGSSGPELQPWLGEMSL